MSIRTSTTPAFLTCLWILACAVTPALAQHRPAASIPAADLIQPADFPGRMLDYGFAKRDLPVSGHNHTAVTADT